MSPRPPLQFVLLSLLLVCHVRLAVATTPCQPSTPAGVAREATAPRYARLFDIEYHEGYKLVTIRLTPDDARPRRFVLLPCGAARPSLDGIDAFIRTPVNTVVVLSNAYVPFLESNGVVDRLRGVNRLAHVSSEAVRAAGARGTVVEVGQEATLDRERLLALHPDLVLTYGDGQLPLSLRPLAAAGIPIIETAEYREPHPLGYAEWVRLFAAFFDTEETAGKTFDGIVRRYEATKAQADGVTKRPLVMVGGSEGGIWYVPTPRSYTAQLIQDAGGRYAFEGLPWRQGSLETMLPIDLETALAHGRDADLWIDTLTWRSREEALAADPRYSLFAAFRTGRMYNNDARTNADGANAFWEQGLAHPDTVLRDLLLMLHPTLGDGASLTWYRPLPEQSP